MNARDHSSLRLLTILIVGFCIASLASCGRRKVPPANAGLKFDSNEFDAGIVETSAPIAHRFVVHNYGNHDVKLSKITTSSPLVTAQASTMVVPAGSDASVDVTLNPREGGDASDKVSVLYRPHLSTERSSTLPTRDHCDGNSAQHQCADR